MMHLRQAARNIIRSKIQHKTTKGKVWTRLQKAEASEHTKVCTRGVPAHEQQWPTEFFHPVCNQVFGDIHTVLVARGIRVLRRETVTNGYDVQ
jgi:hypothetical protein